MASVASASGAGPALAHGSQALKRVPAPFAWDALFVALAAAQGLVVLALPIIPVLALGVWWSSNTIAHGFIHRPFFRSRSVNLLFSCYLSVLLGIPQALWRDRHLAHHAAVVWRLRLSPQLVLHTALVVGLWTTLALIDWGFFVTTYLPGFALGLILCALHGHYEHVRGTTSHYGAIYNFLCFNDGYHVEHHRSPSVHWTRLPDRVAPGTRWSRWPAPLRWLEGVNLETLERIVLVSPALQRFVLRAHRRAFRALIPQLPPVRRVAIVGGGLFPRTALILRELLPGRQIVIIDANARNLETARTRLDGDICFEHRWFGRSPESQDFDLMVIPLSFQGDRRAIYRHAPSPAVLVHDWIWRRRGQGRIVSIALLKRLNLVQQVQTH
jgi:hypothetical protein